MSEHPANRALEIFSETRRYNRWICDLVGGSVRGRVLEVGCGIGNLTEFFLDRELVVGIDSRPLRIDRCRERFQGVTNARFLVQDITDDLGELAELDFDSIVCLHVLEHVKDDDAALRNMRSLLPIGGTLVLLLPRYPWLYCELDRSVGHYRRYAKGEIVARLIDHGFDVQEAADQNFFGLIGWIGSGKLLRRRFIEEGSVRLFDRMFPALRRLEDWLPHLPGLSVRIIARRLK